MVSGLGLHFSSLSFQGLSTRAEEPVSSAVQALKLIHDLFVFFYHSPELVKKVCDGLNVSQSERYIIYLFMHSLSFSVIFDQ